MLHSLKSHLGKVLYLAGFGMFAVAYNISHVCEILLRSNGIFDSSTYGRVLSLLYEHAGTRWVQATGGVVAVLGLALCIAGICRAGIQPYRSHRQ